METKSTVPVIFCIPDITGFTRFITSTKHPEFANEVISTVLSRVVGSNILSLKVAEIEGDAIFFYKIGRLPAVSMVAKQCEAIYNVFLDTIASYELTHPALFKKYLSKNQLGIKIIIHYGHISLMEIEGHTKLMGEDVILAHKLLKNSIQDPCYIMFTNQYLQKLSKKKMIEKWFSTDELVKSKDKYDHFGTVFYTYIPLSNCRKTSRNK